MYTCSASRYETTRTRWAFGSRVWTREVSDRRRRTVLVGHYIRYVLYATCSNRHIDIYWNIHQKNQLWLNRAGRTFHLKPITQCSIYVRPQGTNAVLRNRQRISCMSSSIGSHNAPHVSRRTKLETTLPSVYNGISEPPSESKIISVGTTYEIFYIYSHTDFAVKLQVKWTQNCDQETGVESIRFSHTNTI